MKVEKIKKFRIVDKSYLPNNVIAIEVEKKLDFVEIEYIYDRDGKKDVERFSIEKLQLLSGIYAEVAFGE